MQMLLRRKDGYALSRLHVAVVDVVFLVLIFASAVAQNFVTNPKTAHIRT